jgi:Flp pilus assembly protein TadB
VLGWIACRVFVRVKTTKRAMAFEAQLPDALQLLAGALRSGFGLNQAIGSIVREGTDPVAGEFSRALTEVRLGAELEDALDALAERMRSDDMRLVVIAIRTAREVGGNLAEVLQTTVTTMRERVQLRGQVRVLSAEGRISARVLVALPILMVLYLLTFRRSYLNPLVTTGPGIGLSIAGVFLLLAGTFWLSRLVKIEV